jgi:hypothetical protein
MAKLFKNLRIIFSWIFREISCYSGLFWLYLVLGVFFEKILKLNKPDTRFFRVQTDTSTKNDFKTLEI